MRYPPFATFPMLAANRYLPTAICPTYAEN